MSMPLSAGPSLCSLPWAATRGRTPRRSAAVARVRTRALVMYVEMTEGWLSHGISHEIEGCCAKVEVGIRDNWRGSRRSLLGVRRAYPELPRAIQGLDDESCRELRKREVRMRRYKEESQAAPRAWGGCLRYHACPEVSETNEG